jgi:hypothetical protein
MVRPCPHCGRKTSVVEAPFANAPDLGATGGVERGRQPDAEKPIREFLEAARNNRYRDRVFDFDADRDLSPRDKVRAFRALERLVQSQEWQLKFTSVEVVSGIEDNATAYVCGAQGSWLVLLAGYHYDVNQWKLDAYETSERSFSRPDGESFEDYVTRNIREAKAVGRPYVRQTANKDGSYYVEY